MPKVAIATVDNSAVISAPEGAKGEVETRALFDRDCDPIHMFVHRLGPNAILPMSGHRSDQLVYVMEGEVEIDGVKLPRGSSAIVEFKAAASAKAAEKGAALAVFNVKERRPGDRPGGHVRLLPVDRVARNGDGANGMKVGMALHTDSDCPSYSLWFHENAFPAGAAETALHSHSEDEIIFITAGAMKLGNRLCGPGTALAIAANTKYAFNSGPEGLAFTNFRGYPAIYKDAKVELDEIEIWRKYVGKPEYLTI